MSDISALRARIPVLVRSLGVWEGTFTRVDLAGKVLDRCSSRLTCSVRPDGVYRQVDEFRWDDGHTETMVLVASIGDDGLNFSTERIEGRTWQAGPDNMVGTWSHRSDPQSRTWEILTLTDEDHRKARCHQHFQRGELTGFTLIDEHRAG
jgi:hypothetical protein